MTKYIYHSENTKTTCNECKKNDGKDIQGAANVFDEYINITNPKTGIKEVSQGLVNRRKKEKELFLKP